MNSNDQTPWFTAWRKAFFEISKFSDHEKLEYPIIAFYLVTSEEEAIVEVNQLMKAKSPKMCEKGLNSMDDVPKVVLIMRDKRSKESRDSSQSSIKDLNSKYMPAICEVIDINSAYDTTKEPAIDDVWSHYIISRKKETNLEHILETNMENSSALETTKHCRI